MCGIAGVLGENLDKKDAEFFRRLMFLSQWRGEDSTGIVMVRQPGIQIRANAKRGEPIPAKFIKAAEPAAWFLDQKGVIKLLNENVPRSAMIGHTRAATVGAITDENAHPYDFDHVCGVYNGTTSRFDIENGMKYDTDGEGLFAMLEQYGVEDGSKKILGFPKAPFALAMFDKRLNSIRFLRGGTDVDNRPLWFVWSEDKKRRYFCSDPWFIHTVARYMGVQLSKDGSVQFKRNVLVTVPLLEEDFLHKFSEVTLTPEVKAPVPFVGRNPAFRDKIESIRNSRQLAEHPPARRWDPERKMFISDDEADPLILALTSPTTSSVASGRTEGMASISARAVHWQDFTQAARDRKKVVAEKPWPIGGALSKADIHDHAIFEALTKKTERTIMEALAEADADEEEASYIGNHGFMITGTELQKVLNQGCANCGVVYDLEEDKDADEKIAWCSTDTGTRFVCDTCKKQDWIKTNWITYDPEIEGAD